MHARVPLDVDLEDKLLYGLTPTRLAYVVIAFVGGFAVWSAHWGPAMLRGCVATFLIGFGAAAAWGRWRGRAADDWAVDAAIFGYNNHRLVWRCPSWLSRRIL